MVLRVNVGQVEACFGLFVDNINKLVSVYLEIILISSQDRCTVCTECTIGSEIALSTLEGTPG
jgi:hypothetical protein